MSCSCEKPDRQSWLNGIGNLGPFYLVAVLCSPCNSIRWLELASPASPVVPSYWHSSQQEGGEGGPKACSLPLKAPLEGRAHQPDYPISQNLAYDHISLWGRLGDVVISLNSCPWVSDPFLNAEETNSCERTSNSLLPKWVTDEVTHTGRILNT